MLTYRCKKDNIETKTSVCPVCGERADLEKSELFWCPECNIPLYEKKCSCGAEVERITTDIRPVFPEERLLIEIVSGKPFKYVKDSVWNGTGNRYIVNGEKIKFRIGDLKEADTEMIRKEYEKYSKENTYEYFNAYMKRFVDENQGRLNVIVKEATDYIRQETKDYSTKDMFVSFSGGKDSTVTSDLVMRALGDPKILHIFGDTTLEFPETYTYVEKFKKLHPKTLILSSRNKDKNFEELCQLVGPPSRVMRWCCTIFKTGAINRKIKTLYGNKNKIVTFYGIRRSESASRSKYERETEGKKVNKQITISPIIDWMDFDVWLYLLGNNVEFNYAYRLGYARVGCWCCPNNSSWSEFLSKVHMHEQYEHWHGLLVDFAKHIGKPDAEDYVNDGKWKARQGGNGVDYANKAVVTFEPCVLEENTTNFALQKEITEELYELFKPFGYLNYDLGIKRLGEVYVTKKNGQPILKLQGKIGKKELKVTIIDFHIDGAKNVKAAEEKVKCQLTKYQMCMGCKACEAICKQNAITVKQMKDGTQQYVIDDERCVRCGECINHFIAGCYMRKVLATKK